MGRSVMDGTPAYEQIDFLERKVAELEADNKRLEKAATIILSDPTADVDALLRAALQEGE